MACGDELAWAMAATEACSSTWALLRLAASVATSASRIWDSAEVKLVTCELARSVAYCKAFSPAPTLPWTLPSAVTAFCTAVTAFSELPVELPVLAGAVAAVPEAPDRLPVKPMEFCAPATVAVKAALLCNEMPPLPSTTAWIPREESSEVSVAAALVRLPALAVVKVKPTVLPPEVKLTVWSLASLLMAVNAWLEKEYREPLA